MRVIIRYLMVRSFVRLTTVSVRLYALRVAFLVTLKSSIARKVTFL